MSALRVLSILALVSSPLLAQSQETEPNDSPETATPATRGSTYQASIRPYDATPEGTRDYDYWVITANAGETIFVDIDADEFGSNMNMGLTLYSSDGTTFLASNDNWDGVDPHLEYVAPTTGKYYVLAGTLLETTPWGQPAPYTIHFFQVKCPTTGDPEPNDNVATATPATVGHDVKGMSCPGTDVDFFKYDLDPGTYEFNFVMDPHGHVTFGSAVQIAGLIALYGPDGKTLLAQTNGDDTPDRIEYTVRERGAYFIRADIMPGGIRYTYTLSSRQMSGPAAGDPVTVRADFGSNYGYESGAVVDRNGDILVSDLNNKIWRISPQGVKSKVAAAVEFPAGLAWDANQNLLIVNAAAQFAIASTAGGVFKLSPSGQLTRFITDARADGAIAMARDGSMWLTSWSAHALLHYDAQGALIARYDIPATSAGDGPLHVALGPSGDPYVVSYQDIYRLRNGHAERVVHYERADGRIGDFAFDVQGNIYVPNPGAGVINLHDITGAWLATIAYEPTAPGRVFFGRDADGSTNARLYAMDEGKLIELNPGGARAAGLPVQFDQSQQEQDATVEQAVTELLKGGTLTDAQRNTLDQRGNKNGRYDVGDLRALLIRSGTLTASPRH